MQKSGERLPKIAIIGNPNSGKSSVFNQLTGLRQKTGNFPGVTVEKHQGKAVLSPQVEAQLIDFPGAYSLHPNSEDERVVVSVLANPADPDFPDAVLYVADATNLEKHLLLLTQLIDLGFPVVLALNMLDVALADGYEVNPPELEAALKIPVVAVSARTGEGVAELKAALQNLLSNHTNRPSFLPFSKPDREWVEKLQSILDEKNPYRAWLLAHHQAWLPFLEKDKKEALKKAAEDSGFLPLRAQVDETMRRFDRFVPIARQAIKKTPARRNPRSETADDILTHRVFGPLIFLGIMLLIFQAIFDWAEYPMGWIEQAFSSAAAAIQNAFPNHWLTSLLSDGILAGLGGVVVFVPQIAILFFLITILEEVGYMARVVYMFDRLLQFFGMNGRSIVSLISSGACAIPAIMSARTITNWKERLITIMVTPLISCSARIPVYTVLIGFAVPPGKVAGIFNQQGLAFMGLYLAGIAAALVSAFVFKKILKSEESSFLMIELPGYRRPSWRNIALTVWEKVRAFIVEAGKIILAVSVVLWFAASFGPGDSIKNAETEALAQAAEKNLHPDQTTHLVAAKKLEASYAGHLGKWIEPAISPLGFDWKIGIAIITSFAAREVFVGTMATLYSIGGDADESKVRDRMAAAVRPDTGEKVYTPAVAWSLLVFYLFAMQCMSTLAVVKRETRSWKWPLIQLVYMSLMAYGGSWVVYRLF